MTESVAKLISAVEARLAEVREEREGKRREAERLRRQAVAIETELKETEGEEAQLRSLRAVYDGNSATDESGSMSVSEAILALLDRMPGKRYPDESIVEQVDTEIVLGTVHTASTQARKNIWTTLSNLHRAGKVRREGGYTQLIGAPTDNTGDLYDEIL